MADRYAKNVTCNWGATGTTAWSATSSSGTDDAAVPTSSDAVIFDSSYTGNITIAATAVAASVTCQAGATGTLTWGNYNLNVAGNITFVTGFTVSGATGSLTLSGTGTFTTAGITVPVPIVNITGSPTLDTNGTTFALVGIAGNTKTIYLTSDLACTTLRVSGDSAQTTLSGAHDIEVGNLIVQGWHGGTNSLILVAGQKLTVTSSMALSKSVSQTTQTIRSATASSPTYIAYTGANVSTLQSSGITFTDVDFSTYSTPVTGLDNWYGGTLTRTTGITNRTSADFATAAQAAKILDDTTIGGVTGTIATRTLSPANDTVSAGYYAATTLAAVDADLAAANIVTGKTIFGVAGSASGGGGAIDFPEPLRIGA